MSRKGDALMLLTVDMQAAGIPEPELEFPFAKSQGRRWRFDYAWPKQMVALEVDGGVYAGGRHTSGTGYTNDCRKLNAAMLLGWRVYRVTPEMIREGEHMAILNAVNEHRYCAQDFHRCDGGGPGEYHRYLTARPAGEG
jgi:hypothetical protein